MPLIATDCHSDHLVRGPRPSQAPRMQALTTAPPLSASPPTGAWASPSPGAPCDLLWRSQRQRGALHDAPPRSTTHDSGASPCMQALTTAPPHLAGDPPRPKAGRHRRRRDRSPTATPQRRSASDGAPAQFRQPRDLQPGRAHHGARVRAVRACGSRAASGARRVGHHRLRHVPSALRAVRALVHDGQRPRREAAQHARAHHGAPSSPQVQDGQRPRRETAAPCRPSGLGGRRVGRLPLHTRRRRRGDVLPPCG